MQDRLGSGKDEVVSSGQGSKPRPWSLREVVPFLQALVILGAGVCKRRDLEPSLSPGNVLCPL